MDQELAVIVELDRETEGKRRGNVASGDQRKAYGRHVGFESAVARILNCIKGTLHDGIIGGELDIELTFLDTQMQITDQCIQPKIRQREFFGVRRRPIRWNSKRQTVIALSSCKAEYSGHKESSRSQSPLRHCRPLANSTTATAGNQQ